MVAEKCEAFAVITPTKLLLLWLAELRCWGQALLSAHKRPHPMPAPARTCPAELGGAENRGCLRKKYSRTGMSNCLAQSTAQDLL